MSVTVEGATRAIGPDLVLDDVSITVGDGEVVGLAGANGSGKTMLMRAVLGFLRLDSGHVLIDGEPLAFGRGFPPSAGALIEAPAFLEGRTGLANLVLLAGIRGVAGEPEARLAMERVGLDPDLAKRYRGYSLGMRQRLGIAAAVMESPRLVVLDEPFNALDPEGRSMLARVIAEERARGASVLVSCHDAALLDAVSDRVYRMELGRVAGEVAGHAGA